MDKQKQIEEMAKVIKADYKDKEWIDVTCCIPQVTSYYAECLGGAIDCAEALYNAGYRKIPEGSVVLTEENEIKQYEWSKMLDKMGFFKFADKVRKETVDKFVKMLKESEPLMDIVYRDYLVSYIELCDEIDEIAKKATGGK
jgi:muramoyltetrapeptide carboxypeptidase LdcA involved in peptidoglycan recycling